MEGYRVMNNSQLVFMGMLGLIVFISNLIFMAKNEKLKMGHYPLWMGNAVGACYSFGTVWIALSAT